MIAAVLLTIAVVWGIVCAWAAVADRMAERRDTERRAREQADQDRQRRWREREIQRLSRII